MTAIDVALKTLGTRGLVGFDLIGILGNPSLGPETRGEQFWVLFLFRRGLGQFRYRSISVSVAGT